VAVVALIAVLAVMKPWSGSDDAATTADTAAPVSESAAASTPVKTERKMAVVLPFENLGPPEDAYFAAGMTEEITNRLASVGDLGVISRTSAVGYDRTGKTMKQIGADLGVDYVLEGTVRWAKSADGGGQVRISPKLVRVSDDLQLWSETYDRQITDIFEVQSDIASKVVGELGVTLSGSEQALLAESPTENMEAYQAYLQAIDLNLGDPAEFDRKKVELLNRAIQLDPGFLRAWYELTRHHANGYFNMDKTQARLDLARAALEGIEAVDPDHPMTRLARGYYFYYGFNEYERAVEEFTAAAEVLPNEVECRKAMAYINRRLGNFEEAIRDLELARELDPEDTGILGALAETLIALRRFPEAIRYYELVLDREPGDDATRFGLAVLHLRARGDMAAAKEVMSHGPGDIPLWHIAGSAILKIWERDYAEAITLMQQFQAPVPVLRANKSFLIATATAEMKGAEAAREELETAVRDAQAVLEMSPSSSDMRGTMATLYAYQGKGTLALQEARLGVSLSSKDVFAGPDALTTLAGVHARLGREDEAIDILERLIVTPSQSPVTVHILELDPVWDPLRQNPRFQELLEKRKLDSRLRLSRYIWGS
jgi:TolB-like protein/Tfp pilus assembly protein PilF